MKTAFLSALATLTLAAAPVGTYTKDSPVGYDDAMKCSALFALLSAGSQGSDSAELEEMSTRWLIVAMERDGTDDGSKADTELEPMLDDLIAELEKRSDKEEAEGEKFLIAGIEFCEGKQQAIAAEIDGIELE